jgi:hypothetical protein
MRWRQLLACRAGGRVLRLVEKPFVSSPRAWQRSISWLGVSLKGDDRVIGSYLDARGIPRQRDLL